MVYETLPPDSNEPQADMLPEPLPEPVYSTTQADPILLPAAVDTSGSGATQATPLPPHTAAAAHGVLTTLESDLEKEYAKGQSHFLTWMKMKIAELKLHLKV